MTRAQQVRRAANSWKRRVVAAAALGVYSLTPLLVACSDAARAPSEPARVARAGISKDGSCVGEAQGIGAGTVGVSASSATPMEECGGDDGGGYGGYGGYGGDGGGGGGGGGDGGGGGGGSGPPTAIGGAGWGDDAGVPVYLADGGSAAAIGHGDVFGDGRDFIRWAAVAPAGEDAAAAAAQVDASCPFCLPLVVVVGTAIEASPEIEEVAENPEVEQEAAAAGEQVLGFAQRLLEQVKNLGARTQGAWHHVATDKNFKAGQQWSIRFKALFDKFNLSLSKAPQNLVYVVGHAGPHPDEYHQEVLDRLTAAAAESRDAFLAELQQIAEECSTPGTYLNELLGGARGRATGDPPPMQ